jgi:hypothetical protein
MEARAEGKDTMSYLLAVAKAIAAGTFWVSVYYLTRTLARRLRRAWRYWRAWRQR